MTKHSLSGLIYHMSTKQQQNGHIYDLTVITPSCVISLLQDSCLTGVWCMVVPIYDNIGSCHSAAMLCKFSHQSCEYFYLVPRCRSLVGRRAGAVVGFAS